MFPFLLYLYIRYIICKEKSRGNLLKYNLLNYFRQILILNSTCYINITFIIGLLVLVVGVEPTRPFELRILSPVRLPFRHTSIILFALFDHTKKAFSRKLWWTARGSNPGPPD